MGSRQRTYAAGVMSALVLGGLYLTSLYSYLLFHTIAEVFSAAVAMAIFMLVWNVRRSLGNTYLLFVGIAYLFIGGLDLVHTLAYKGMGVFGGYAENLPTQLWIGARYLQSVSLLVAPLFLGKQLNLKFIFAGYVAAVSLLLGTIFYWEVFPACFVAGEGLTPFKKLSEYVISVILLGSIALLIRKRDLFDPTVLRWLVASISLTILSEMCFSIYVDIYGVASLLGHFFKIISFYCIYKAIIELGMARPFAVLFRNLKESEDALRKTHDELERRVEERTAELVKTNELLAQQMEERKEAEKARRESEERYQTLVETMNEGFGVADERDVWTYVNEKFCKMSGFSYDEIVGHPVHEWLDEANRKIYDEQSMRRRKGEQEPYEIAGIRKDGSTIHALVSPKPTFSEDGEFKGSFAVFSDITERKKAEESLRYAFSEIRILKDRLEAENIYFRQEIKTRHHFDHIIGQSNAFKYVLYRAEQVASTNTTVLLLGETGTGKGLIAAAIHQMSPRKDRPLVTVNCAALPANLIESELFGREKGAFTGADTRQIGRFDLADGSTICLDEIGELPLEVQAKLLRVIQDGEFERLGSSRTIKVDVRIVATTNRNLEVEVRKGNFRQDLYYRLNVFPLTVPPLRQRKEDIPLLVQVFTERYAREHAKEIAAIPKETMNALKNYDWPGNVRELENVIERAVILCQSPVLQLADKLEDRSVSPASGLKTLEEMERDQILKTLTETRWRINGKNGAATILGLHPSTLRARMQKLGIRRPEITTPD
jgi:PAS domain S-box-containing protein